MELRSAKEIMESIAGDCDNPRGPRAQQTMVPTGEKTHTLTDNEGHPVGDIMHSLNVAGHPVTSDVLLMEKQQTFNRSKTVERMVHPCGSGAFGYFETTTDMSQYTKAKLFNGVGKRTPVFVRFSTVTYGKEFPDSARNPRGFAIKFYTEEGNYDLVGLNFPVFFVRDPALGPDVIRSQQRNPQNFLLNFDSMNDFMAMVPESLHCGLMFFSDHGTPYGWRHMHGYGAHTFKWVNEAGEAYYIKYTFRTDAGVRNFTYPEAVRMCGEDPDFAKRDLYEHIRSGKEATWRAYVQIMPAADALTYRFDPFDVTKVWPRGDYPLHEFGRLVLNRNPDNFHRDVEQAAFSPGSLVPGIEPSPDLLLQFRMFLYRDTQYYRLGTNLHQIPVNFPFRAQNLCPFSRDGTMRMDTNGQSQAHYMPNSYAGAKPDTRYNWQPVTISGELDRRAASRHEARLEDDLIQARELYSRVMDAGARRNTAFNIAATLKFCQPEIVRRSLIQWYKVHPNLATDIARDLGYVDIGEIEKSAQTQPAMVDRGNAYNLVTP